MSKNNLDANRDGAYLPISDYAIIGDARTAALVAVDGAIDWWCWPEFASPAVFCRILDSRKGGYFQVCPAGRFEASRAYEDSTNVLVTTFRTSDGTVRLTDFMPYLSDSDPARADKSPSRIVRIVEGVAGDVTLEVRFHPTFGFAEKPTEATATENGAVAHGARTRARLDCPVPLKPDDQGVLRGQARVRAGQRLVLHLACATEGHEVKPTGDVVAEYEATLRFWRDWASVCKYQGPYRDSVIRSTLVLKLLTFDPSGALIAAPTTSLPEVVGGIRNWDYRYAWLRDSALILEALEMAGYTREASHFFAWLRRVWMTNRHNLDIMYGVDGSPVPVETDLANLDGYLHSRPVRVGNAAAGQCQLDVYGEILEAAHYAFSRHEAPSPEVWQVLRALANEAARRWREVDRGIWEVRGQPRPFLYSRVLCWAALKRALDLARHYNLPGDFPSWESNLKAIRHEILEKGFNKQLGAFTQYIGGDQLDASVLVIPIVGFLSPTDPRVLSTIDAIRKHLTWHGLLLRYVDADGLPGRDAAFALASFWLVDNLAMAGKTDEAKTVYERLISFANDVGLLSEEIDPINHRLLGNFPQGFSHLGMIRSAYYIARAELCGPDRQPTSRAQRTTAAKKAAN